MQNASYAYVGAEVCARSSLQRFFQQGRDANSSGKRKCAIAEISRRMEEYEAVNQIIRKEGSVQLRTALQQKTQNLPLSNRPKHSAKIEPPAPLSNARNLDADSLK